MKTKTIGLFLVVTGVIFSSAFAYSSHRTIFSQSGGRPEFVKDTLSSSQLSYFGRMGVGVSVNDSLIKINQGTDPVLSGPSKSSNNLFIGDTIAIGTTDSSLGMAKYTVSDIASTSQIVIDPGISGIHINEGNMIIATRSAVHTITFTPMTNYTGGIWQFLIRATTAPNEPSASDGIPDQNGFDLGSDLPDGPAGGVPGTRLKPSDITCPWPNATASIGATYQFFRNGKYDQGWYQDIRCTLDPGTSIPVGIGNTVVWTIGRPFEIGVSASQLINPAPGINHIEGRAGPQQTADAYSFFIRQSDASGTFELDNIMAPGKIAVIESVRVTATVDPNLTFIIDTQNVGQGSSLCGNDPLEANANDTTATAVTFGSLDPTKFNNLAQHLRTSTNAYYGYAVTVYQDKQLTNLARGATIPDTTCDSTSPCNISVGGSWTWAGSPNISGWGYSMNAGPSTPAAATFTYETEGYRPFGIGYSQAQTIMRNNTSLTMEEDAYICYRLGISIFQPAANYENKLIFTATATF